MVDFGRTEFGQSKLENFRAVAELYKECVLLAHRSVKALDAINEAQTRSELLAAEEMIFDVAKDFKRIEIIG